MVDNTVLYSEVKNVLHGLKDRGYKIAIVTTKYHYRIEQILDRFELLKLETCNMKPRIYPLAQA